MAKKIRHHALFQDAVPLTFCLFQSADLSLASAASATCPTARPASPCASRASSTCTCSGRYTSSGSRWSCWITRLHRARTRCHRARHTGLSYFRCSWSSWSSRWQRARGTWIGLYRPGRIGLYTPGRCLNARLCSSRHRGARRCAGRGVRRCARRSRLHASRGGGCSPVCAYVLSVARDHGGGCT